MIVVNTNSGFIVCNIQQVMESDVIFEFNGFGFCRNFDEIWRKQTETPKDGIED